MGLRGVMTPPPQKKKKKKKKSENRDQFSSIDSLYNVHVHVAVFNQTK